MATKQTESAPSFLQVYTQVRRDRMKHSFLHQINSCVDWRGIRTLLNKKYTKTQNAIGNPAYDALLLFKILNQTTDIALIFSNKKGKSRFLISLPQ